MHLTLHVHCKYKCVKIAQFLLLTRKTKAVCCSKRERKCRGRSVLQASARATDGTVTDKLTTMLHDCPSVSSYVSQTGLFTFLHYSMYAFLPVFPLADRSMKQTLIKIWQIFHSTHQHPYSIPVCINHAPATPAASAAPSSVRTTHLPF